MAGIKEHVYSLSFIGLFIALSACSGGGSSSSSSSSSDTVSISGKVLANTDDVVAVATKAELQSDSFKLNTLPSSSVDTGANTNANLSNATVTLYKVFSDDATPDEQVDIGTVTTDASGNYSITDVPKVPASTGQGTDFYYELRVSKGGLELKSPMAVDQDASVNVSPETDLAAKLLTNVIDVPGVSDAPVPSSDMIESIREMVLQETATLANAGAIAIPSALEADFSGNSLAAANGIAAAGGNGEKLFKAASFNAEYLAITANNASTDAQATGYLNRMIREACDQASGDYLPEPVANAFGTYFNNGGTLTPAQIVTAYNANFSGPDIDLSVAVNNFSARILNASNAVNSPAVDVTAIDAEDLMGLYVLRSLNAATFSSSTALEADQAMAFIQNLGNTPCNFTAQLDLFGFIADLLSQNALRSAAIAASNVYHNSGFGCNEGSGEGHFVADIKVYKAGKTITSVVIASSDPDGTVLGGDGEETLTFQGGGILFDNYVSNTNAVCVNLGKEVTYTLTVTFSDATTVVGNITRNHPRIPEATSEVYVSSSFQAGSGDSAAPTVVKVSRPLYRWTSPADMRTAIVNDASNVAISADLAASDATVKYTYEFSHVDTTVSPVSPAGACGFVSSGKLYAVDSFIPTEACDVAACAALLSRNAADIACRMNIQSYLVDRNDKILGQAAGHFRFFCVDTDNDGNCG